MSGDAALPAEAWLSALCALPGVGPARLRRLTSERTARDAWADIGRRPGVNARACGAPALGEEWRRARAVIDVADVWSRYQSQGFGVVSGRHPAFPEDLRDDPDPPAVLFTDGDLTALGSLRVGVVGTRRCTRYGIDAARELGAMLAANGITVVSGLAAGIDAAAHAGALEAGHTAPVAVVGTALDRPYPRANSALWRQVAVEGLVCGETPLGAPAERWRFPARNRIIAGLCQVLVVVESHETGGSLHTAAQAMERNRTVFAVPGPIRSPASMGCNRLIADGCLPLCELSDVMVAIGAADGATSPHVLPVSVDPAELDLLDAVGWRPTTLDELAALLLARPQAGSGAMRDIGDVAHRAERLVERGILARRGPWLERTATPVICGSNDPTGDHTSGSRRQRAQ